MGKKEEKHELEELEIYLLLEGIFRHYGFDFREYSLSSLRRRVRNAVNAEKVLTISGLLEKILHEPACLERFLLALTVNVTSMFRDPEFYLAFRQKVIPLLRTYPSLQIWHAGCSTGEEVYSLAVILEEEGLLKRSTIYATDINEIVLKKAKEGIFPLENMKENTGNYLRGGGNHSFSDYYTAAYGGALMRPSLKENIVFAQHNLVSDSPFNHFQVIFCRNVTIYFNKSLQQKVHKLLYESLINFGVLGLGSKESIRFTPFEKNYEHLEAETSLYRKIS